MKGIRERMKEGRYAKCPYSRPLSRAERYITHMLPSSRYGTAEHLMMDTAGLSWRGCTARVPVFPPPPPGDGHC